MIANKLNIKSAAQNYIDKSLWKKAILELKKLVTLDKDDVGSRIKIAQIYEKVGDENSAHENYIAAAHYYANKGLLTKVNEIHKKIYPNGNLRQTDSLGGLDRGGIDKSFGNSLSFEERFFSDDEKLNERLNLLYAVPLFSKLNSSAILKINEVLSEKKIPSDMVLIREGDVDNDMYIIKTGVMKVTVKTDNQRNRYLTKLSKCDFFGEASLLTGKPRSATISAMTDAVVLVLKKIDFEEIAKESPSIKNILLNYCHSREAVTRLTKSKDRKQVRQERMKSGLPVVVREVPLSENEEQGEKDGLLVNISLGGLCFELDGRDMNDINPGKTINLILEVPGISDTTLDIFARILWTELATEPSVVGYKYFVGVEFDHAKTKNLMALEFLVSSVKV